MKGPLAGIRVIEVGHMLMGPYCGMLLADLGAEVIKIEPATGDIARTIGPNWVGRHNVYFASLNRNKESVVLDLATEDGQQALGELLKTARALVTNLRPAAIKKLGLTYDRLKRWNPDLVCVALTGYGLESPYSERPAYDYVIQALTGVMNLTGDPAGPPTKTGYSAVDNSTALMGAVGLLAKLVEGKGGQVDIAMYDTMLSQLNYVASAWLNAGESSKRYSDSAHPYIVPAQNFRTADGWLTLFVTHNEFWRLFCEEVGHAEWLEDERFATNPRRVENRALVNATLQAVIETQSVNHWVDVLEKAGVPGAPLQTIDQVVAHPQTLALGMVQTAPGTDMKLLGLPVSFNGERPPLRNAPPALGADTSEILKSKNKN